MEHDESSTVTIVDATDDRDNNGVRDEDMDHISVGSGGNDVDVANGAVQGYQEGDGDASSVSSDDTWTPPEEYFCEEDEDSEDDDDDNNGKKWTRSTLKAENISISFNVTDSHFTDRYWGEVENIGKGFEQKLITKELWNDNMPSLLPPSLFLLTMQPPPPTKFSTQFSPAIKFMNLWRQ